jgi:hypothetical protein
MFARHVWSRTDAKIVERARGLFSSQTWGATRTWRSGRQTGQITVDIRFDDNCKNGHHTFAITGTAKAGRDHEIGGCIHEEIAKYFPELAPLIKWHLFDQTGPMHYVSNTVYLAGDRDYNGLRNGESRQLVNGRTKLPCWELALVNADGTDRKHAFEWIDAETCPQNPPVALYRPRMIVGEGKERQLDAARSVAVWPEATDAELMQEPAALKAALLARLPGLVAEFRADMERIGFAWDAG